MGKSSRNSNNEEVAFSFGDFLSASMQQHLLTFFGATFLGWQQSSTGAFGTGFSSVVHAIGMPNKQRIVPAEATTDEPTSNVASANFTVIDTRIFLSTSYL